MARSAQWAFATLELLLSLFGHDALAASSLCTVCFLFSTFSGAGTAEIASQYITSACASLGLPYRLQARRSCDNHPVCQEQLRQQGASADASIFGDVTEFLTQGTDVWRHDWSFKRKQAAILASARRSFMHCYAHGTQCPAHTSADGDRDVEVSGPPCTDWSRSGAKAGYNGSTMPIAVIWLIMVLLADRALILIENVCEYPLEFLAEHLSAVYHLYVFYTDPADVGYELINRRRMYVLAVHRVKATLVYDIYAVWDAVRERLRRHRTEPDDCLLAPAAEIRAEVDMLGSTAARRPHARPDDIAHALNALHFVSPCVLLAGSSHTASKHRQDQHTAAATTTDMLKHASPTPVGSPWLDKQTGVALICTEHPTDPENT